MPRGVKWPINSVVSVKRRKHGTITHLTGKLSDQRFRQTLLSLPEQSSRAVHEYVKVTQY